MKSRFRKQYSKIKFDTVSLCDIVKMAKVKDEEAVAEEKPWRLFLWEGRWTDAEETEEAVRLSGLSQPDGWKVLPGTPSTSEP